MLLKPTAFGEGKGKQNHMIHIMLRKPTAFGEEKGKQNLHVEDSMSKHNIFELALTSNDEDSRILAELACSPYLPRNSKNFSGRDQKLPAI